MNMNMNGFMDKLNFSGEHKEMKMPDKVNLEVQEEVLEDIIVINAGRKNTATVPTGYVKIEVDLNEKAGGDYLYFAIKKGTDKSKAIDSLVIIEGKNAAAPNGYERINVDLNNGAGGKYLYLCKRRGGQNPLKDIKVVSSKDKDVAAPAGYTMIKKDLNENAGGRYIYLCYR